MSGRGFSGMQPIPNVPGSSEAAATGPVGLPPSQPDPVAEPASPVGVQQVPRRHPAPVRRFDPSEPVDVIQPLHF